MKKRTLAALSLALITFSFPAVRAAAVETGYSDLQGHYAQRAVETWSGYGILTGYPDGSFRPDGGITRGEMAAVLDRIMGYQTKAKNTYSDVPSGKWYTDSILHLAAQEIFKGTSDGIMAPDSPITRQEAFCALARALSLTESEKAPGFTDDASIPDWAKGYIAAMRDAGYIEGDPSGALLPAETVTRGEVVTVLDRMVAGFVNTDGTYSKDCGGNLIVNARNITLKNMTIKGDLIVADGTADGDVYLDQVNVGGSVILRGCGQNSFRLLPGCKVENIIVTKTTQGAIRLVNESGKTIPSIWINDGTDKVILDGSSFGNVVIACDVPVVINAQKVKTLSITRSANVTVSASSVISRAEVTKTAKEAALTINGRVTTLVNDAGIKVEKSGSSVFSGGSSSGGGGGSSPAIPPTPLPDKVISEVSLQLLAPAFGEIPDAADELGVGYSAETHWFNLDGTPASYRWKADPEEKDTFTANQAYQAVITLTPTSGYVFSNDLKVTVTDGKALPSQYPPASVEADKNQRIVTMKYAPTENMEPVFNVRLTGSAELELNTTGTLTLSYSDNRLMAPSAHVIQWYRCNADGGDRVPIPDAAAREYTIPATDTASEATLYYLCTVTAGEKEFPSQVKQIDVKAHTPPPPEIPQLALGDTVSIGFSDSSDPLQAPYFPGELQVSFSIFSEEGVPPYQYTTEVKGHYSLSDGTEKDISFSAFGWESPSDSAASHTCTASVGAPSDIDPLFLFSASLNDPELPGLEVVFDKVLVSAWPYVQGGEDKKAVREYDLGIKPVTYHLANLSVRREAPVYFDEYDRLGCPLECAVVFGYDEDKGSEYARPLPLNWQGDSGQDLLVAPGPGQYSLTGSVLCHYAQVSQSCTVNMRSRQDPNHSQDILLSLDNTVIHTPDGKEWTTSEMDLVRASSDHLYWTYIPQDTENSIYIYWMLPLMSVINRGGNS